MADVDYKIILLGEPGVGKTTWFLRIKHGEFVDTMDQQTAVSLGVDHHEHQITIPSPGKEGGVKVKVRARVVQHRY